MQLRLVCLVSAVLLFASHAVAEMYRYVDRHGQVHFTDEYYEVPEQYRDQVADVAPEYESRGNYSVVPGFGEKPGAKAEKDKKGAKGGKGEKEGIAGKLQGGVAKHFNQMTGKPLSAVSPGLLVFMALLALLIGLAIAGGILITGCNVAGERAMPLGHAMLIVLVQSIGSGLASFALTLTLSIVGQPSPALAVAGAGLQFVTGLGIQAAVLKGMHCDTWGAAFKVTLVVLLLGVVLMVPVIYCAVH
jgi:hypothetical protein